MRSQAATFVLAIVFGVETSAAHAQLLARRDLSYSIAKTIAETAIESCTAGGYRVSAVVVDRDGETIVALRGDNASPHAMENARRKAKPSAFSPRLPRMRSGSLTATPWCASK
jgi:uncharacterized protein GlcG (DUF336 family)